MFSFIYNEIFYLFWQAMGITHYTFAPRKAFPLGKVVFAFSAKTG